MGAAGAVGIVGAVAAVVDLGVGGGVVGVVVGVGVGVVGVDGDGDGVVDVVGVVVGVVGVFFADEAGVELSLPTLPFFLRASSTYQTATMTRAVRTRKPTSLTAFPPAAGVMLMMMLLML